MDKYTKTIKLNLYDCFIKVIITDTLSKKVSNIYKIHNCIEKDKTENPGDNCCGCVVDVDMNYYLLYNENYPLTSNTIYHEIYHLVQVIMKQRGIESKDDESGAWLMGYISQEVVAFFKNKNIKVD